MSKQTKPLELTRKKSKRGRFYEVKVNDEGELLISSEVSVNKDSKGIVVGGTYNTRDGRNWVKQVANKKHLSADQNDSDVLDKNQSFVREFLLRHEKQACFVAYLQQSLTDIERFSTTSANPRFTTPLACDTTFNIANYLVTQTTYKQMSVIGRESLKNPWFPGPFLIHRNQSAQDFSYFWQAVKRGNPALSSILVLGTDEDEALSGGVLKETSGTTIHLLGKEHVQASVDKKLQSLNFPSLQRKIILSDIFGGSTCKEEDSLYGSESVEAYNRKVLQLKSKWLQIEKEQTSNRPSNQFVDYFESYKEKQIRDKMIKGVRKQASIDGVYGQNPIEWQNFLSKDKISAQVHSEGRSHRDATLSHR